MIISYNSILSVMFQTCNIDLQLTSGFDNKMGYVIFIRFRSLYVSAPCSYFGFEIIEFISNLNSIYLQYFFLQVHYIPIHSVMDLHSPTTSWENQLSSNGLNALLAWFKFFNDKTITSIRFYGHLPSSQHIEVGRDWKSSHRKAAPKNLRKRNSVRNRSISSSIIPY